MLVFEGWLRSAGQRTAFLAGFICKGSIRTGVLRLAPPVCCFSGHGYWAAFWLIWHRPCEAWPCGLDIRFAGAGAGVMGLGFVWTELSLDVMRNLCFAACRVRWYGS